MNSENMQHLFKKYSNKINESSFRDYFLYITLKVLTIALKQQTNSTTLEVTARIKRYRHLFSEIISNYNYLFLRILLIFSLSQF